MKTSNESTEWSHVIATDIPKDAKWTFAKELESALNVHFKVEHSDGRANVSRFYRIIIYITKALKLFFHKSQINLLISWQQFFGLIFASLCHLFHSRKQTNLIIMMFIYRPKSGVIGKLYRWWVHSTLSSGYIDHILVYSQHEIEYYARLLDVDSHLFHFIPLAIDKEDIQNVGDDGFWFSTGKSNRDYEFLINTLANTEHHLEIACDTLPQPKVQNIKVHHKTFGNDMLALMGRAHGVIISLDDENVSSGQLVILQAMSLGKPIIITHSYATSDYVKNETNALIIDKTPQALLQTIERLNTDDKLYHRLSIASKEHFNKYHSMNAFARGVANLIN